MRSSLLLLLAAGRSRVGTGYLEILHGAMSARPDTAIAYTDVQWFGAHFHRDSTPSIEGTALSRVLQHIEAINYIPLRGLVRSSTLPADRIALATTPDESCHEEFVFLAGYAAAGALRRVDGAMYFKRAHRQNAYSRWVAWPGWRRRRGWLTMGAGLYRMAAGLATIAERPRILAAVADRLGVARPGRAFLYLPPEDGDELHRFVRDLVDLADVEPGDLALGEGLPPLERPIHPGIAAGIARAHASAIARGPMSARLAKTGKLHVPFAAGGDGAALLGFGWSVAESWGVWNDGDRATLRVPIVPGEAWRATVRAHVNASPRQARIRWAVDGDGWQEAVAVADDGFHAVDRGIGGRCGRRRDRVRAARCPTTEHRRWD